jgi:glycosyltransferase involved in cell wall biosynthesis
MHPIISIIIPTCDRVHLLNRAIESVLGQSFTDFEIIVVDDHSEDCTVEFLKGIHDKRIRYIARPERGGGSAARNTGVAAANGEYLAFLDDDDAWHGSKLQRQLELMQQRPGVGLVYTGAIQIYQDNGRIFRTFVPQHRGDIFKNLLARNVIGTTSSIMVRRQALDEVGAFDEAFPSCQDWDLYLRLAKHWQIDFIGEPLVDFFLHPVRITNNQAAGIEGRKMILEKFSLDIEMDRRVLSAHHATLGRFCCQAGRYSEGRPFLLQAVRRDPGNVEAYKHLLPVLVGGEFYRAMLMAKRNLKAMLSGRHFPA